MYHIIEDKRAYKSAKLICEGLARALERKDYKDINISEVCEPGGVARTTFYRLFDTLDDVLMYQFDSLFMEAIEKYKNAPATGKGFTELIIEIATNNKALVTAIVSAGRSDLFDISTRTNEGEIISLKNLKITAEELKFARPMMTQIAYAVFSSWVENGCRESAEELYRTAEHSLKIVYENL